MKKITILLAVCALLFSSCAEIYLAPVFSTERSKHKTMAILPFKIAFSPKSFAKGTDATVISTTEEKHSVLMQEQVYTYFLKRLGKGAYTIDFQDISRTNALLKKANIGYADIPTKTKEELATLLGVDVVLSGSANMSKPMSDGVGIAIALLGGIATTNQVTASLSIHDKQEKLMWHYNYSFSGGLGTTVEQVGGALMKNVSKKFPYKVAE